MISTGQSPNYREQVKAVLFVDNAPSHPEELQNGDIIVKFLPVNVTSLMQPTSQQTFRAHIK